MNSPGILNGSCKQDTDGYSGWVVKLGMPQELQIQRSRIYLRLNQNCLTRRMGAFLGIFSGMCANYSHRGVGAAEVRDDAGELRPLRKTLNFSHSTSLGMDYLPDYTYIRSM